MMEGFYVGTELKYKVTVSAENFDMAANDFKVEIVQGARKLVFPKSELVTDGEGNYFVCFDTAEFRPGGSVHAVVTAYVPDLDFPDMLRTEVYKVELGKVMAV